MTMTVNDYEWCAVAALAVVGAPYLGRQVLVFYKKKFKKKKFLLLGV